MFSNVIALGYCGIILIREGLIFEACQTFTGSWGRNFVDRMVAEKWEGGGGG